MIDTGHAVTPNGPKAVETDSAIPTIETVQAIAVGVIRRRPVIDETGPRYAPTDSRGLLQDAMGSIGIRFIPPGPRRRPRPAGSRRPRP